MSHGAPDIGLWTYEQTARFLGSTDNDPISARSIMRLCQQGKLRRVYPIPKKPRIDPISAHEYVASLLAQQYDGKAQDGGQQIGAERWQKSIPAQTVHTSGAGTKAQMASKLDNLLRSRKVKTLKKLPN